MNDNYQKGLTFIRKNGRIIPIAQKDGSYSGIMKGTAKYEFGAAAGAATVGYGSARIFMKIAKKKYAAAERGFKIEMRALSLGNLKVALKAQNFVKRATKGALGATKIAANLRGATFLITSGLIAAGLQSLAASKIKNPNAATEFALTGTSLVTGGLATKAGLIISGKYKARKNAGRAFQIIKRILRK
jgi:hypothetical protein